MYRYILDITGCESFFVLPPLRPRELLPLLRQLASEGLFACERRFVCESCFCRFVYEASSTRIASTTSSKWQAEVRTSFFPYSCPFIPLLLSLFFSLLLFRSTTALVRTGLCSDRQSYCLVWTAFCILGQYSLSPLMNTLIEWFMSVLYLLSLPKWSWKGIEQAIHLLFQCYNIRFKSSFGWLGFRWIES